jgi:hypothetical protein
MPGDPTSEAVSIERQATLRVLLPSRSLLVAHNVHPPRYNASPSVASGARRVDSSS